MKLTLEKARELLKAAVETQGEDFVYHDPEDLGEFSACFYSAEHYKSFCETNVLSITYNPDSPRAKTGCLVGTALTLAGIDPASQEESEWRGTIGFMLNTTLGTNFVDVEPGVSDYWGVAQRYQDDGKSWGEAYDLAEAHLAEKQRLAGEA